ncbi:MAG: site-2 protease family protein [Oscillospiraceae bacterium]
MLDRLFGGNLIFRLIAGVLVLVTALPVHEFAHAWMAERMGDMTARSQRRLSLNPLDHIDPIGALMILFLGFGFARPVPINSMNFRDRRKGIVLTSLAGPVSNILMATLMLILRKMVRMVWIVLGWRWLGGLDTILAMTVSINLSLAVFNLLPLPPLDGWHAVSQVLPPSVYWKVAAYEQQIMWVVLLLAMIGFLSGPISWFSNLLYSLINRLTFFMDLLIAIVR